VFYPWQPHISDSRHVGFGKDCFRQWAQDCSGDQGCAVTIPMNTTILPRKVATRILSATCFLVLGIILATGLWPFNPLPGNDVSWLQNQNGLHFGNRGIVISRTEFGRKERLSDSPSSIEIWMEPTRTRATGTLLAFDDADNHHQFRLTQYDDSLVLRQTARDDPGQEGKPTIVIPQIFQTGRQKFISIIGSPAGTSIFVDGTLIETSPRFTLSQVDTSGQLFLGTSPIYDSAWSGQIHGLAVYDRSLAPVEVLQHQQTWVQEGYPGLGRTYAPLAIYLFNERTGNRVYNLASTGGDLYIPKHFTLPHQKFLERPWDEFRPNRSYAADVAINVVGFVPLGFFFCVYVKSRRLNRRPELTSILLGAGTSLLIEVLQAFLPTRSSGMTDLITNTVGTTLGVYLSGHHVVGNMLAKLGVPVEGGEPAHREKDQ
jgi:VanZ family protein